MAFPLTHIKTSGGIELTDALRTLVEQKLATLEKFIGDETDVSCDVELEKISGSQSGMIFRAEVNFFLKGKMHRAEATTDQIEKSIDEVRAELHRELERTNSKAQTLMKRGGLALKNLLRFGR